MHVCPLIQALLWFKSPPRYFARWTRRAAAEQVAALDTFIHELQRTLAKGARAADKGAGSVGDLVWASYRTPAAHAASDAGALAAAAAGPQLHPVWGVQHPNVAGYIHLLLCLCNEELMRLRVWTDPLKHSEATKSAVVRSCLCGTLTPLGCRICQLGLQR